VSKVAVIPGDGIGQEVIPASLRVLDAAADALGQPRLEPTHLPWSCAYYAREGRMMPPDALEVLDGHDAILLGAIGSPEVPDHTAVWGLIMPIRQSFRQFVNLRPIKLLPGVQSPLRDRGPEDLDIVVVRENSEGEYADVGGHVHRGHDEEVAVQTGVFSRKGIERIVEYAFAIAERRPRRQVASATKSNAWAYAMPLWDEVCLEVAGRHPDVAFTKYHVDALAARFATAPDSLDVVVASNLFGDILSDLGAALAGSLGTAPSGNIDPTREHPSMFEPIHGSAPDIAGQGIANPFGAIWAGAMMLEHLGRDEEAALVVDALEWASAQPETRTPDLGGSGTTESVAAAVAGRVAERTPSPA
jgi:tartrate dehydrogenase/decarboxylase/D-malate dehydrogenase